MTKVAHNDVLGLLATTLKNKDPRQNKGLSFNSQQSVTRNPTAWVLEGVQKNPSPWKLDIFS